MNGNHYGGYHHGMSVTENIFNAIQMEHSMSRAPGESYSKLPIPTTTTTLTKDTDETGSKSINQYLILDVIGQGACGKVKLALDLNRGTTVAIKQVRKSSKPKTTKSTESAAAAATTTPLIGSPLSMSPKLGRRVDAQLASLKREIAIMKKIRHKNVVALHEVIDDPLADKMYLIMQYVDQGSVGTMKFDGTCEALPLRKVADIVAQVASGLHFLHASGVVHRDIKPENILSSSEGHVYLSDFGVSTLTDRGNNGGAQAGGVNGTPLVGKQLPIGGPTFKSVSANETSATTFSPLATNMGGNGGGGGGTLLFMPPEYFKDGLASSLNSTTSPADSTTTATGGSPSSPTEGGSRLPPPPIKTSSLASTGVTLTSPFERQCAGDIWALGVTIYVLVYGRLPFATMDLLLDSSFTPEFPATSTFDPSRGNDALAGSTETAPPNTETVPKKLLALLKAMLSREAVLRPRPHQIRSVAKLLKRELQTVEEQESSIDNDLLMMAATMTPTSNVAPPPGLQLSSGGGIASAHSKRHGATIRVSIRDLEDALTPAGGLATPPQNELLRKFSSHLGPLELPSSVGFDGVRGAVSPSSPPPASAQSAEFESPSRTSPTRSLQPRPPSSETPGTRRPMTASPGP
ncbi:protein kinase, putative [Bodo saltans]|uniref:Protein kinase, putative n=1 Tax=Bodo saltans TaxID=75058 RepID=A0A0S4J0P2_BODSA|nr:protein kinase, putative [Bodo saltans]|eukprot:CUG06501.1 protein kinase, putative [Bodo saltans]